MSPIRHLAQGYSKLAVFSGTSCRREFWWLFAANTGLLILSVQLTILMPPNATMPLLCAGFGAFFFGSTSAAIRRLKDAGRSPFWLLAPPILLVMLMQPSRTHLHENAPDQSAKEKNALGYKLAA